ncbi:protein kinase domain-containing protein [Nocardiopsis prasina]|uniref:protein kinase domain-containing protein n=1 Tax=Nocardiopsis prasina TaxID=2015 RepID=UPI00034CEC70|nr:serine/threonine-protein kinase [Nocardiopsis prasina]
MPTPGRTSIGRYELRERLGAGGMGTVWHAWDPALQRDVAVKEVLLPQGMSAEDRAEAHARTLREAQATARISHTAVVTIHDVLEHDASPWIVMELLSGTSLQHHIDAGGPMPVERVEQAARSLLGGLAAAHAAGVTHRDVKPANIMFTADDRTVLTDFGIANVDGGTALTQTGVFIGSPEYMAPERFEGERALPASDLWSLGVTLYCLLEGRSPFRRDSITGMISAVMTAPVPRPSRNEAANSPRSLALLALIAALLTRDAAARPSPREALELLERERHATQGLVETHRGPTPGPEASGARPSFRPTGGTQAAYPRSGTAGGGRPTPNPVRPANGASSGPRPHPAGPPMVGYPGSTAAAPAQDASARFVRGTAHTGARPAEGNSRGKPTAVLTVMAMLALNALVLFVLTAVNLGRVGDDDAATGWGTVVYLAVWGVLSAFAAFGLLTRSRLVFGLVVVVQAIGAVTLAMSMFTVFIYTPELMVIYALMLIYTLTIGGLLLVPARSRAYFGLG